MKRKIASTLLCVAVAATMIAGCGSKAPAAETKTEEKTEATTEEKKEEKKADQILTMPVSATVTTVNPLLETMAEGTFELAPYADELYFVDDNETRWYLAEKCDISDDGLTYTLKLRDGLKWHDGEKITADDVVFTTKCIADTNNGSGHTKVVLLNKKEIKVEKVDELTVKFTLPEVSAAYFETLGKLTIIPEHIFDGKTDIKNNTTANLKDMGSGPYKLVEFKDGESLVLEKFEDYYGDAPQLDKVIFKVIGDASAKEVAFKNGEINFLTVSSDKSAEEIEKMDNVTLHKLAEGRVKYLAWNKYSATWNDRDAVKAVFLALDQEKIVQGAYGKYMGTAANSILCTRNLFYDSSIKGYKQDLTEAKKLAEKSGLAGKTITLHYNTDRTYMEATALMIQEQLKAINVTVDVKGINANGFFDVVFTDKADYELYLNEYGTTGDPDGVVAGMFDGTWGINVDTSAEILQLFKDGRSTTDPTKRAEIYKKIQQKAFDQYLVYPIAQPSYIFATPSNLDGTEALTTTPVFEDYTKLSFK